MCYLSQTVLVLSGLQKNLLVVLFITFARVNYGDHCDFMVVLGFIWLGGTGTDFFEGGESLVQVWLGGYLCAEASLCFTG